MDLINTLNLPEAGWSKLCHTGTPALPVSGRFDRKSGSKENNKISVLSDLCVLCGK